MAITDSIDEELNTRREFDRSRPLARDESHDLISSEKVDGTPVYSKDGEKIGHIDHLMIGKLSGRVEYAVMSFGGFLGMAERHHPLPWAALDYEKDKGGYVVNIDKDQLRNAPQYDRGSSPMFDREYGENIYAYYGLMY